MADFSQYEGILHLPHHRSEKHPAMSMRDRAAQFSSFRALSGYEDAIDETSRLTDRRAERSEEEQRRLDLNERTLFLREGQAIPLDRVSGIQIPEE